MSVHTAYCASCGSTPRAATIGRCTNPAITTARKPSVGRVLELVDRLVGRVHRDLGDREQPVGELGEHAGVEAVEGAARTPPVALVVEVAEEETEARVDDADVDAELGEALVEEAGKHRGGAVDRRSSRRSPTGRGDAASRVRSGVSAYQSAIGPKVPEVRRGHRLAVERHALLDQLAGQGGEELDGVTVDVDHRVVQLLADSRQALSPLIRNPWLE